MESYISFSRTVFSDIAMCLLQIVANEDKTFNIFFSLRLLARIPIR